MPTLSPVQTKTPSPSRSNKLPPKLQSQSNRVARSECPSDCPRVRTPHEHRQLPHEHHPIQVWAPDLAFVETYSPPSSHFFVERDFHLGGSRGNALEHPFHRQVASQPRFHLFNARPGRQHAQVNHFVGLIVR